MTEWRGTYDPLEGPDPDEWNQASETERQLAVEEYHHSLGEPLPNPRLHAAIHVTVENQVAAGDDTPVEATLERLIRQGLDRHEAIHAIGFVLSKHIYSALQAQQPDQDPGPAYYRELEELTPESWRREAEDAD